MRDREEESLIVLITLLYRKTPAPFKKKALWGWAIILLIALFQLSGFLVSPDRYLTLEGNRLGMFMFEANHQCIATITKYYDTPQTDLGYNFTADPGTACVGFNCLVERESTTTATGTVETLQYQSGTAWNRCDPYTFWFTLNEQCKLDPSITRTAFQFDHSINGGPFYEIVNVPNICGVQYQPFSHNAWIELPPQAPIVGYPVENWYHY